MKSRGAPQAIAQEGTIAPAGEDLAEISRRLRVRVLRMIAAAKSSHIGSAYSIIDLLAVLYFRILAIDPTRPDLPERDRFLLSKGHAGAALYATLAARGFFPDAWLDGFYQDGGALAGHADAFGVPGVEISAGSLGHGLSIGCGIALAAKLDGSSRRVFVLMSDGECDEGSTWEAALAIPHLGLNNVVAIVDYNKLQGMGSVAEVMKLEPLAAKWRAFGWEAREIDGHDLAPIEHALGEPPGVPGRPVAVIAHTVKGKGVSFMEDQLLWHYRTPAGQELQDALGELGERA
jgi:transketolase